MKISVVIRNKDEEEALSFLLEVLENKYSEDIDEVIVLDNMSTDKSEEICGKFNARFVTIKNFSYGGSANIAANEAKNEIVVIFSAHSYPVSHDFFKLIREKFLNGRGKLAGVRCIHNNTDYRIYLKGVKSEHSPNLAGLIFAGSAFSRSLWQIHPFNDKVRTFEDKEWSIRMLKLGFKIEVAPAIFSYYVKRSQAQLFFRFKNDMVGGFQIFGEEPVLIDVVKVFLISILNNSSKFLVSIYYTIRRFIFLILLKIKGFKKFKLISR